jgi:hypothetical protein
MGMLSFNKYINGTDPDDFQETYNYMRGLNRDGTEYTYQGNVTRFFVSGNPNTGEGDLDAAPADRRFMQTTGPVTFPPGDSTEILVGIIVGQGADRLSSISVMNYYDEFAQGAYNIDFKVPIPPVAPVVNIAELDGAISLVWDDTSEVDAGDYPFEGYTVFQGETAAGPWRKVANYDLDNGIGTIFDFLVNPLTGALETVAVKFGVDAGAIHHYVTREDAILGGVLRNMSTYYYKVEAYSYDETAKPKTLTSATVVSTIPQMPVAGTSWAHDFQDTIGVDHDTGPSGGQIYPFVTDPTQLTGHTYRIVFEDTVAIRIDTTLVEDPDLGFIEVYDTINVAWHLDDIEDPNNPVRLLEWQDNQSGDVNYIIVDGMQIIVTGPPAGFQMMSVVANANGPLDPPQAGAFEFAGFPVPVDDEGNNTRPDDDQQATGDGRWGMHTADNGGTSGGGTRGDYDSFVDRITRDGANVPFIGIYDYEMRFTGSYDDPGVEGSWAYEFVSDDDAWWVPFELWNIGIATTDDPSDDFRMPMLIIDWGDKTYNLESWGSEDNGGGDYEHSMSSADNDPFTDWVYWYEPADMTPGEAGYLEAEADLIAGDLSAADAHYGNEVMARMVLVNWNGGDEPPFNQDLPEVGTIFRLETFKPNTPRDTFTFVAPAPTVATSGQQYMENINVVPNPFYLYGPYDPAPGNYHIRFQHLPGECTISIYNLGGDLVATIDHDNGDPYDDWDARSDNGLPVASGIYIYVVDSPEFGTKIGKMAVFTEIQVLPVY